MEESRVILDSNIFIAFCYENDSLHEESVLLMQELQNKEIIIPYCVIQEVTTILAYKLSKKAADNFLNNVKQANNVLLVNNDVFTEINFYQTFTEKISFTDIALMHLSRKYKAPLFTFDKQLISVFKKNNKRR